MGHQEPRGVSRVLGGCGLGGQQALPRSLVFSKLFQEPGQELILQSLRSFLVKGWDCPAAGETVEWPVLYGRARGAPLLPCSPASQSATRRRGLGDSAAERLSLKPLRRENHLIMNPVAVAVVCSGSSSRKSSLTAPEGGWDFVQTDPRPPWWGREGGRRSRPPIHLC